MLGLLEPVVADHVAAKRVISLLGVLMASKASYIRRYIAASRQEKSPDWPGFFASPSD